MLTKRVDPLISSLIFKLQISSLIMSLYNNLKDRILSDPDGCVMYLTGGFFCSVSLALLEALRESRRGQYCDFRIVLEQTLNGGQVVSAGGTNGAVFKRIVIDGSGCVFYSVCFPVDSELYRE